MPAARVRVHQDLTITAVDQRRDRVVIGVREPNGVLRRICFWFDDHARLAEYVDQLTGWMTSTRRLTYVTGGVSSALIDDAEAFRRAFDDASPDLI
ncbi:MAG TPA: hypothetical protein VGK49_12860 [Ilumatobacteraceae bacterium]